MQFRNEKFICMCVVSIVLIAAIGAIIYTVATKSDSGDVHEKIFGQGAIVTNGIECAEIGRKIAEIGGTFADVAIAAVICEGITCPQSSGLGGGFLATMYIRKDKKFETLNSREVAPKLANATMFVDDPQGSIRGGKAVAVPGELRGLWDLHQKYGKLPWKILIEPSITLCREGHVVSPYLNNIFSRNEQSLLLEPSLREIYVNPQTNKTYGLGDKIKRLQLAKTLEIIANEGVDAMYGGGTLAQLLVKDIREKNGIITEEDFLDYRARWRPPVSAPMKDNYYLTTNQLPSTGSLIIFIMNLLKDYELKHDALSYHRIVEAFKFAYGKRTHLGDQPTDDILEMMENLKDLKFADDIRKMINDEKTSEDFKYYGADFVLPEDHGTAHISILMPNGDAIAITSTINYLFGSFWRSLSTGIIMNNEMDDFSTPGTVNFYGIPASPANFIQPGKNPLSSMSPLIMTDQEGNPRLIIGGAGGSRITTGVAFSMIKHLFMNESLTEAINGRRLHHQLAPMELQFDTDFDQTIVDGLKKFGHAMVENPSDGGFAAVVGISKIGDKIEASTDIRRGGSIEIFDAEIQLFQ